MKIYLNLFRSGWTLSEIDDSDFLFMVELLAYGAANPDGEEKGYINEVMGY